MITEYISNMIQNKPPCMQEAGFEWTVFGLSVQ